jgi:hypothetical protein
LLPRQILGSLPHSTEEQYAELPWTARPVLWRVSRYPLRPCRHPRTVSVGLTSKLGHLCLY